jgi:bacteriocin-like protein
MREDHSKPLREVSATAIELSDSELENVVGGGSAQTFHPNTQRFDPYKSFRF